MKHYYIIPDCPKCGTEMRRFGKYQEGAKIRQEPFAKMIRWWECPACGEKIPYNFEDVVKPEER